MDVMSKEQTELQTILTKLGSKKISLGKDEAKVESLDTQIALYQGARQKLVEGIALKKAELDKIHALLVEYKTLTGERDTILSQMRELIAKFDAIPWRADLRTDEKIEHSGYPALETKVAELQERINEIPKVINRIYYRRGEDAMSLEDVLQDA